MLYQIRVSRSDGLTAFIRSASGSKLMEVAPHELTEVAAEPMFGNPGCPLARLVALKTDGKKKTLLVGDAKEMVYLSALLKVPALPQP